MAVIKDKRTVYQDKINFINQAMLESDRSSKSDSDSDTLQQQKNEIFMLQENLKIEMDKHNQYRSDAKCHEKKLLHSQMKRVKSVESGSSSIQISDQVKAFMDKIKEKGLFKDPC